MKLHWSPRSPFVRKAMIAAHELGLADRIELLRTVVAMRAPNAALLPDNPLNKIPTLLLDDGTAVHDSLAIMEVLDHLAGGGRLFPPPGPARWAALTRHALGNGLLDLLILWRNERDRPEGSAPPLLDAFAVKCTATLDRMEADCPADAARLDVGDIAQFCALGYLDFRFPDIAWRDARPRLAAWHAAQAKRPSAMATEARDG